MKYQLSNENQSPKTSIQELDNFKLDIRDLKLRLEKLNDEVAIKSNIKDVCALVDLKANTEDIEKSLDLVYNEI